MAHSINHLPHKIFLSSGVKIKELSQLLKDKITQLEVQCNKVFEDEGTDDEISAKWALILSESENIKKEIQDGFLEEKTIAYTSKDDIACDKLWRAGKTEVSVADFRDAGGDTGFYSSLGQYGFQTNNFSLTKKRSESNYKLNKK